MSEQSPTGPRFWSSYWNRLRQQKEQVLNVRASIAQRRTGFQRIQVAAGKLVTRPLFFVAELVFHLGWLALNGWLLPRGLRWDPYPFSLLTGLASTQGLFIGLLILMYEEQGSRVEEVREETGLQVSLHTEREATKLLRMVAEIHEALAIPSREFDEELREMAQPLDPERLKDTTEKEIERAE